MIRIKFIKKIISIAIYNFNLAIKNYPNVASIEETINEIINNKASISRFGDGELAIIQNKDISFQKFNMDLSKKLKEVLNSNDENCLICIPDIFSNIYYMTKKSREFWMLHLIRGRKEWNKNINKKKRYYNAFISRPYMNYNNKKNAKIIFEKLKCIWKDRDILIIEGEKSRLGIGNDLFDSAKTIKRIICPTNNAFSRYDQILDKVLEVDKEILILIALGPTATVLSYELYKNGYQAIDIGHVDIEYEWFIRGAETKINIPNKFVNEVKDNRDISNVKDINYLKQIICDISD